MPEKIKAPLVLTLICAIICGLLAIAYNATYVDNTGVITDALNKGLTEIFGEGEYEMLKNEDGTVLTYDGVTSVIVDKNGNTAFEIVSNGYSKGGLRVLVGVTDEGVKGISFINIAETPGLGTKVKSEASFVQQFIGVSDESFDFKPIMGATKSSNGMKKAVETAVKTYNEHKAEFKNSADA